MQNNLRNRSVALASTFALALSGIVATAPAASAASTVELKPSSGTNTGALITDNFLMDVNIPTVLENAALAIKIDNPKQEILEFQVLGGSVSSVVLRGFDATGAEVDFEPNSDDVDRIDDAERDVQLVTSVTNRNKAVRVTSITGRVAIDFEEAGITSLIIEEMEEVAGGQDLRTRALQLDLKIKEVLDADAANPSFEWGDANQGDITVTSWVETEATPDYTTVDSATASDSATVKWYDPAGVAVIPSIERFVESGATQRLNDEQASLAGKVRFIRPDLNLNQVDLTNWDLQVRDTAGNVVQAAQDLADIDVFKDGTSGNADSAGAIYFNEANNTLQATSSYTVRVSHKDQNALNTRTFNSAGFTPATNDAHRDLFVYVTDSVNADQSNNVVPGTLVNGTADTDGLVDDTISLRPGEESFTYTARLYDTNSSDREKVASQTVLAVVTAGAYMPSGTEYTVTGSSETLDAAGDATVVAGLTDSDGEFSVTVTSSNPIALTSYNLEFFTIDDDGDFINELTQAEGDSVIVSTYTAASIGGTSLTLANTVLSGTTPTVSATVTDNYGVGTNKSGTDDLYLTVQATNTSDLDETVAVGADGTASISFENFVASGQSDLLNVYVHTGSSYSSLNQKDSEVVSLYNPDSVAAVNAPATATGVITYDDFITGTASSTNVAPNDGAISITGTAVDSNGQGVPGAVITVEAAGMQLRQSGVGDYAQDSITFAASAAGAFTVQLWSHTVSTTGVDVTISSGAQSATSEVKTYLPENLSGGNLVFDVNVPTNIDANKTYAIQASLTDNWGNPVRTTGSTNALSIVGAGAVQINSTDSATTKQFGKDGKSTIFLRSIKDIEGPGSVTATLQNADYTYWNGSAAVTDTLDRSEVITDVAGTAWDETSFSNEIEVDVNVGEAAQSSTQKVNAGSFKGYVAVYALGYEGQRLSAKIGNDWVIVDPIVNNESANLARITDFTGAGVDIAVRIYIDRVLIDTINLTTK